MPGPGRPEASSSWTNSSLIETYGLQKQGGKDFSYPHTRGYHPLFAVLAEGGEVIHSRREGKVSSGRGAANFARQALARLRRLGRVQEVVLRADSGFYAEQVVLACQAHGARFSISVRLRIPTNPGVIPLNPGTPWSEVA